MCYLELHFENATVLDVLTDGNWEEGLEAKFKRKICKFIEGDRWVLRYPVNFSIESAM